MEGGENVCYTKSIHYNHVHASTRHGHLDMSESPFRHVKCMHIQLDIGVLPITLMGCGDSD